MSKFSKVDASKALELGADPEALRKKYQEQATISLIPTFVASQISGLGGNFDASAVINKARELSEAYVDIVAQNAKSN